MARTEWDSLGGHAGREAKSSSFAGMSPWREGAKCCRAELMNWAAGVETVLEERGATGCSSG